LKRTEIAKEAVEKVSEFFKEKAANASSSKDESQFPPDGSKITSLPG
jgi:hypothetical protein